MESSTSAINGFDWSPDTVPPENNDAVPTAPFDQEPRPRYLLRRSGIDVVISGRLLLAVLDRLTELTAAAMDAAKPDEGPAAEALLRVFEAAAKESGRYAALLQRIDALPVTAREDWLGTRRSRTESGGGSGADRTRASSAAGSPPTGWSSPRSTSPTRHATSAAAAG
ncbi:hypothetical protein IU449_11995 [Nocardia higoensis]|uniref:Uncharacterized protein n=1 Tax=Nocardia higoensis TaxID=228599 RepID=A0ABS0D9W5_9NOCA|nr:hypothetical protein [Nocardia higoensis]MBF6355255.1 hypothetical protein [Nocardia higoensis]